MLRSARVMEYDHQLDRASRAPYRVGGKAEIWELLLQRLALKG